MAAEPFARRLEIVRGQSAAIVLLVILSGAMAEAQAPAAPGAGTVGVASGGLEHTVARLVDGRLVATAPCVPTEGPLDAAREWRVTATGVLRTTQPRAIRVGSEEWTRVGAGLLALADRREREQRLATESTSRVPRFLDWLFGLEVRGGPVYYFETSRRLPSPLVDTDTADTDPPGTVRIAVSGFAQVGAKGATPLGTKGELRWEEDGLPRGPVRPDLLPLGIVMTSSDVVWMMEGRTPAASTVSLFAVGPRGATLLAATRIGRC